MTVTTAVVVLPRRVAVWATRRALARTSLTGIELACSLCAAVWFSAGTPMTALAGGVALGGGCLARRIGRQLALVRSRAGWPACARWPASWPCMPDSPRARGRADRVWALASAAAILLGMRKVARLCRPARARDPGPARVPAGRSSPDPAGPGGARGPAAPAAGEGAGRGDHRHRGFLRHPDGPAGADLLGFGRAGLGPGRAAAGKRLDPRGRAPAAGSRALRPADIAAARDDGPLARFAGGRAAASWCRCPPPSPG